MANPNSIEIILKGLMCIFVSPDKSLCTVGILQGAPKHELKITLKETQVGGPTPPPPKETPIVPKNNLTLDVQGAVETKIVLNDPVAKLDRGNASQHTDSASWFVDLENPAEFYKNPIGASATGFKPILTFNAGTLFTREISKSKLLVQRGQFADYGELGFVAVRISAGITLNPATSQAVFKNGDTEVFKYTPGTNTNYQIEITHEAPTHPKVVTDANLYYKAVGLHLNEDEKIRFMSITEDKPKVLAEPEKASFRLLMDKLLASESLTTAPVADTAPPAPPAGPEAACFPAFLGQTGGPG